MIFRLAASVRSAYLSLLVTAASAGGGPATLTIYDGDMPEIPGGDASASTVLGVITLADPIGTVDGVTLTFSESTPDLAIDASGDCVWACIRDSNGAFVADMDVTVIGMYGAIQIENTVAVYEGGSLILALAELTV